MIRAADTRDADAVVALWTACGLTRPWNDPRSDFRLALDESASAVLLVYDETAIVGSVMVGFDGHRGWVYYLAVAPDVRRGGIGRGLMTAAEDWLRERGAPKMQLMVRGENADALDFYARIGLERQDVVVLGRFLKDDG